MALRAREGARLLARERSPGDPLTGAERESAIRSSKQYGEERKRSPNLNFTANISEAIHRAGFTTASGNESRASSRPYSGAPASSVKSAVDGTGSAASTPTGQAALEAVARAKNSRNFSSML